jgi:hypothetical protein
MGPCGGGMRRGGGCCPGCGRGFGFGGRQFISPKNELSALEAEKRSLEEQLAIVREEKEALKKETK